jgi:hypothetical protein
MRLEIPILREISALRLKIILRAVVSLPVLTGIKEITISHPNCIVDIGHDPLMIDIKDYIEDMAYVGAGLRPEVFAEEVQQKAK